MRGRPIRLLLPALPLLCPCAHKRARFALDAAGTLPADAPGGPDALAAATEPLAAMVLYLSLAAAAVLSDAVAAAAEPPATCAAAEPPSDAAALALCPSASA